MTSMTCMTTVSKIV